MQLARVIEITFKFVSTSLDPEWQRIQAAHAIHRPRRVRGFRNDNVSRYSLQKL